MQTIRFAAASALLAVTLGLAGCGQQPMDRAKSAGPARAGHLMLPSRTIGLASAASIG